MKKMNPRTGEYEKYSPKWKCTCCSDIQSVSDKTNLVIKCAYCGKEILCSDAFCSHLIQPDMEEKATSESGYLCCYECIKKNEIDRGVL